MRTPLRAFTGLIAIVVLTILSTSPIAGAALTIAPHLQTDHSSRSSAATTSNRRAHTATSTSLTCKTVPTSVISAGLATSVTFAGTSFPSGKMTLGSTTVIVNGAPLNATWIACDYLHIPGDTASLGVSVSYLIEPSAAKALAAMKAMCSALRSFATNYTTPAVGNGACIQGHAGAMQSANGFVASRNVVIQLFGSQSPAQTLNLVRRITPIIARTNWTSTLLAPGGTITNGPVISVMTTQFNAGSGFVPITLHCTKARCSGAINLTDSTTSTVVATTHYNVLSSSTITQNVPFTVAGSNFFATSTVNPAHLTLTVTVAGGKTVTLSILVTLNTPPTSAVTTTTDVTTTTPQGS